MNKNVYFAEMSNEELARINGGAGTDEKDGANGQAGTNEDGEKKNGQEGDDQQGTH